MIEIVLGVVLFTAIVLALVGLILLARRQLVAEGTVPIVVNEQRSFDAPVGGKLLGALADAELFVSSACGGGGTCGQCKVHDTGGRRIACCRPRPPTSASARPPRARAWPARWRSSSHEDRGAATKSSACASGCARSRSNRHVATFIKELVLELPQGEALDFRAGGYIVIECPPHRIKFSDFDIAGQYRTDWDRYELWRYVSDVREPVSRAYSMANFPLERDIIMLNVRIATPPPSADADGPARDHVLVHLLAAGRATRSRCPGRLASSSRARPTRKWSSSAAARAWRRCAPTSSTSWSASAASARSPSGTGLAASARSSTRRISTACGRAPELQVARGAVRSAARGRTGRGYTGFIHKVLHDEYLRDHPAPEDCEYYLCGPPLMTTAVIGMLEEIGVERGNIMMDDFGL